MIKDIQEEILRLKKEKDIAVVAHSYQSRDIVEIADCTGDSFALSVWASKAPQKAIVMCGVRFMAETAKILSPEKTVILANETAGCPMAEQMSKDYILKIKKENPGYAVVTYINTTAELKTVSDVCVTSSSAVKIVKSLESEDILFIPDCNLGSYVAAKLPEKNIKLLDGGCPIHASMTAEDVEKAKALHPKALFLVHPECKKEVTDCADFVGSTADIMRFAKASDKKEFIIGTENSIAEHLSFECPDKRFYPLSKGFICEDMKATTLIDVLRAVQGIGGEVMELDGDTIVEARKCIDEMIKRG